MRSGNGGRWGAISQGREFFPKRFFAVLVHLLAVFRNEEKKNCSLSCQIIFPISPECNIKELLPIINCVLVNV